jgi:hypothetical protein
MAPPVLGATTVSPYYSDDKEDGGYTCNTGFTTVEASTVSNAGRRNEEVRRRRRRPVRTTTTFHRALVFCETVCLSLAFLLRRDQAGHNDNDDLIRSCCRAELTLFGVFGLLISSVEALQKRTPSHSF